MKDDRQVDIEIARRVFGRRVLQQQDGALYEELEEDQAIPLTPYSTDMSAAWTVVELLPMALIPIEGHSWFALVGEIDGWKDPAEFIKFLQTADFVTSGAAVSATAPLAICLAALKAVEKREILVTDFEPRVH